MQTLFGSNYLLTYRSQNFSVFASPKYSLKCSASTCKCLNKDSSARNGEPPAVDVTYCQHTRFHQLPVNAHKEQQCSITKLTICPRFSCTVSVFNNVSPLSRTKSQFSRDDHLSRFWLDYPDLSQFAHLCSHMLMH